MGSPAVIAAILAILANSTSYQLPVQRMCQATLHLAACSCSLRVKQEPCAPQQTSFKPARWHPWQLSPSQVQKDGNVTRVPGGGVVKNTFIDQIDTPLLRLREGCRQRARSVPKDMGSRKDEYE